MKDCDNLPNINLDAAIAATFVDKNKTPYKACHTITERNDGGETIGYTIRNSS